MKQEAHTPGPWVIEAFGSPRVLATDEKGSWPICDIRGWGHLTGKGHGALGLDNETAAAIQDANARLIAAAPALLKALEAVHAPYATLTAEALEAGILMEFGPPKPEKGRAQLQVRAAIAATKTGTAS